VTDVRAGVRRRLVEAQAVDDAANIGRELQADFDSPKIGDFDTELEKLRRWFDACPPDTPLMDAVHAGVVEFNRLPRAEEPWHRRRMALILNTPALQAHSTHMYARWRAVIAEFVAKRTGARTEDMIPQLIAYAALGAAVAAYEQWLRDEGEELEPLLDVAMGELQRGFGGHESGA